MDHFISDRALRALEAGESVSVTVMRFAMQKEPETGLPNLMIGLSPEVWQVFFNDLAQSEDPHVIECYRCLMEGFELWNQSET